MGKIEAYIAMIMSYCFLNIRKQISNFYDLENNKIDFILSFEYMF